MEKLSQKIISDVIIVNDLSKSQMEKDVETINTAVKPPKRLTLDDVHIRECWLTGDAINCYYGRFRTESLKSLLKKTEGSSLLIGHKKDSAPIGRFFGGTIKQKEVPGHGIVNFIVPKLYWMRNASNAEDLRINIDGGIYKEASISWYFDKPTCSICGEDIRLCMHVLGKKYKKEICFYWYDGINDVLEGSIVFAGGHPGTEFNLERSGDFQVKKKEIEITYKGLKQIIGVPENVG